MNHIERPADRRRSDLWAWCAALGAGLLAGVAMLTAADAVFAVPFAALVLVLARADLDRFELPDAGNLGVFALGLAWVAASSPDIGAGLGEAVVRAMAAGAFLFAVRTLYRALRGMDGLGLGDVKLGFAGAVWLSWAQMPIALLIGALAGLLVASAYAAIRRQALASDMALPLGAFLAPAIWLVWFAGRAGLI